MPSAADDPSRLGRHAPAGPRVSPYRSTAQQQSVPSRGDCRAVRARCAVAAARPHSKPVPRRGPTRPSAEPHGVFFSA